MSRLFLGGIALVLATLFVGGAFAEDPSPNATEPAPKVDPSSLPKFKGQVVQALGGFNSYLPPRAGAEVEWDLKTLPEVGNLTFKPLPGDDVGEYYIPLGTASEFTPDGSSIVVPLKAVSGETLKTGAIRDLRFVSQSERLGPYCVKVDVISLPGRGHPNFAQIWVTVEREVLSGVLLIEGKIETPASKAVPAKDTSQTTIDGKDPIETAIAWLRERKTNLSKHDVEKATASKYCPPQSTVYQWAVHIPAKADSGAESLWIALPEKGEPWRLDPKTLEKLE